MTATAYAESRITMTGQELRQLMNTHKVSLRELKARTGITLKRIRQVRKAGITGFAVLDWQEAILGYVPPRLMAQFRHIQRCE